MKEFHVSILAADSDFYEGPCVSLVVPTIDGEYGILADHSNVITAIEPGPLYYTVPGEEKKTVAVSNGLLKVVNGEALVLVASAERPEDIDVNRAKRAADIAREELLQKRSRQEYTAAQSSLARALNRLRVKGEPKF